ncbi:MAG: putative selenate reductase subunit YgfK [Ignavibacteriales bacterium]|nr:putative selenate reductase subunit YgfK [Ignavibacteriales bacterium]
MSDKFYRIPIERLYKWIVEEEQHERIFGLYKDNLFTPKTTDQFRMLRYGKLLETPLGVAAGPHTQMAHNIIASWLVGARYIELKTVQTLDELEVTKPCIDMEDEGYNCEWSQELKIKDSYDEYLNAWILIHLLKHKFGWDDKESGFIFNLSVGYNLDGILKPNVQWFFDKMNNCKIEKDNKLEILSKFYPEIHKVKIPNQISNNITLSTMHGCPSDEIEKIGKYLIEERKLHTTIKLNPTLLGAERLRFILNNKLGYKVIIPDEAFEHDLKYEDALLMINSLQRCAIENNVEFGLKLTNTLESLNTTNWLPKKENMVYTSGRALHPISINLAEKLQSDFEGKLDISFSAGVDVFNVSDTLACNLKPITVCSDLLKPGGYLRINQYFNEMNKNFTQLNVKSIDEFIKKIAAKDEVEKAGLTNLRKYAVAVLDQKQYHKSAFPYENIKTKRELTAYDCIHAPCIEACAVDQDVPEYMFHTANGDFEKAFKVILEDNPLPNITGNVCDHLCQTKCTKMNYDNSLLIRGIKRFNSEMFEGKLDLVIKEKNGLKVSVLGAGPSGLSCAYFLALDGYEVELYESKPFAGGMASDSIPHFRITNKQIKDDIDIIESLGVKFHFNQHVDKKLFSKITGNSDYIYIGIGAQKGKNLNIEGENLENVFDQLTFLSKVRRNETVDLGKKVAILGGGNSAVDAARTSNRLVGKDGNVAVVYRRTISEMPADPEEIRALMEEGIHIFELAAPLSIEQNGNQLELVCIKMELGERDDSGRRRPIPVKDSEFSIKFDSIITAIGQDTILDFIEDEKLIINTNGETQYKNIFAGGDATRGADSLINAIGDGKDAAKRIMQRANSEFKLAIYKKEQKLSQAEFQKKQSIRKYGIKMPEIALDERDNFNLVHPNMTDFEAINEADRCLYCNDICNICIGVCPNFANVSFEADIAKIPIYEIIINGSITSKISDYLNIEQTNQIFNIGDFCNECGNCNTFCPTSGAPYITKPKFYLTEDSFSKEDNCYHLGSKKIKFKSNGEIESVLIENDFFIYESAICKVIFKNNFQVNEIIPKDNNLKNIKLEKAAEMIYLLKNLVNISIFKE